MRWCLAFGAGALALSGCIVHGPASLISTPPVVVIPDRAPEPMRLDPPRVETREPGDRPAAPELPGVIVPRLGSNATFARGM